MSAIDQNAAIIKHWLGESPASDTEEFMFQTSQAVFLEARYFSTLAKLISSMFKK